MLAILRKTIKKRGSENKGRLTLQRIASPQDPPTVRMEDLDEAAAVHGPDCTVYWACIAAARWDNNCNLQAGRVEGKRCNKVAATLLVGNEVAQVEEEEEEEEDKDNRLAVDKDRHGSLDSS